MITKESAESLALSEEKKAYAIIKANDLMLGVESIINLLSS